MTESETLQPYLSVDFGEYGGRHEWMTHDEAMNWISQLQSQWSWVQQGRNPPQQAWQNISGTLANNVITPLQHALNYRKQGQVQNADNHVGAARSHLEGFIRSNPWLLPNNAQRRFVEELRDSGKPLEAAMIVC